MSRRDAVEILLLYHSLLRTTTPDSLRNARHAGSVAFTNDELVSLRSVNRASVCAGAAVDALVSVDYVLAVALSDSLSGAVLSASAARDAIVGNLVCHG